MDTTNQTVTDRVCSAVAECGETEFETTAPGPMNNRVCQNVTVCGANSQELVSPTNTTDRVCELVSAPGAIAEAASSTENEDAATLGAIFGVLIACILVAAIILLVQHKKSSSAMNRGDSAAAAEEDVTPIGAVDGSRPKDFWAFEEVDVEISPIGQEFVKKVKPLAVVEASDDSDADSSDDDAQGTSSYNIGHDYLQVTGAQGLALPPPVLPAGSAPLASDPVLINMYTSPADIQPGAVHGNVSAPMSAPVSEPVYSPTAPSMQLPGAVNDSDEEEDTAL
jgi:hypothetical protein